MRAANYWMWGQATYRVTKAYMVECYWRLYTLNLCEAT